MVSVIHDHAGAAIGLKVHETTYSAEAIALMASRLERAESEREQLRAELAYVEVLKDALSDLARFAEHPEYYDCAEVCTCGLDRTHARVKAARAALKAFRAQAVPSSSLLALGRAMLAYEQARSRRNAEGVDVGTEAAARAVYETRRAYLEALKVCMEASQ